MKNRLLLKLFLLLAAQQLFFLLVFPPITEPDSNSYMTVASQALSSGSFSADTRLPGYPVFLSLIYGLFGQSALPVIVFQHLLGLLLWFVFVKMLETDRQKLIFSALYFCDLLYNSYQHAILSDFFFSFLICMSAWLVRLYSRDRRPKWIFLCGLLVALAVMTKPALKLFPLYILPVFLADRQPLKRRLAAVALFLAVPLLAMNMWCLRNYLNNGYYSLLPMESYHYIGRMVNHLEFPKNSIAEQHFLAQMPGGKVPRNRKAAVMHAAIKELRGTGIKSEVMDAEFKQIVRLSILRHPFIYLKESGIELFYFFFSAHNLYAKQALKGRLPVSVDSGFQTRNLSGMLLKIAVSLHPFYWMLFSLLAWFTAVNALKLAAERDFFMLYIYGLISYIAIVSSMANEGLARHRGTVQPLMIFICTLALSSMFSGTDKSPGPADGRKT